MRITVIGGGNIGTLMAAEMAHKGHQVTMYTSKPQKWHRKLEVYDIKENYILGGILYKVTNSIKEAIEDAEYIWVAMPAQLLSSIAFKMLPYVKTKQKIGIVPGSGGAEFAFKEFIKKGCILFGLQRVHSIARLKEYGKSSYMLGRKKNIYIASIPRKEVKCICKDVSFLFNMPCEPLDNYLSVTLTPSNPILHTTRLYSIFKDYKEGVWTYVNIVDTFFSFLSRLCNKIFISLWSHITNSAMNSFSVIPTFNILKY
ncbi:2-dehydropantoate 2-reductase N-terminal domain-containing protein [Clostridium sp. HCP1S3_B4]|uniref:2-dehydropantoate 2-reductase N-terminal domain-containing protein n=1 Tax=Clostridium sp. HCP1S3_B4 TaxID=3438918 RepID=UPI003F8AD576